MSIYITKRFESDLLEEKKNLILIYILQHIINLLTLNKSINYKLLFSHLNF